MTAPRLIAERFEIADPDRDLLGRGGMGLVYRATDTQTGLPVAVKNLKPEIIAHNPDLVARFVREGEALRQLDHPNIVKMVDAVEEDGQHYLMMEYVEGGSLQELLRRKRQLPLRQVLEISLDLADALTRAHRLNIIHRDLKPANVLLAHDGTPRLTDFGLAYMADTPRLTQADVMVGTLDYLSPEACHGDDLDARTDIWSFGVMVYEMLTGELPFHGHTTTAKLLAILTQPAPDLEKMCPEAPDALADLVYRMLGKDRQQRIPSVRLVGVELEAILQERDSPLSPLPHPSGTRFDTPTAWRGTRPRHNLPTQPTPFVGREAELLDLARLLGEADAGLLTILGPGGMGKTRLALEVGGRQLDKFRHGVFFASLAPLQSADAIVPTVANSIGFSFYADTRGDASVTPEQQLLDYLHEKEMLLILDNFEHLLGGVDLVPRILEAAPGVKILVTSRARLNVRGEHLFYIGGMEFPDWEAQEDTADSQNQAEYSAVKLFMQSAQRANPSFELQADDLQYVARICRLTQGMPLAILLAAAWIEMLTPQEIATEISKSPDFLETDLRDVPERQRSIRAVFDYSWALLAEREREVFQALSVFRGGFTRQAAQEVIGTSLRELMRLVDRSLLHRMPTGRYEVHELLRQYAEDKLNRSPDGGEATRERHCTHYTIALQHWWEDLKGPRQIKALAEMNLEMENTRAAWIWAAEHAQIARLEQGLDGLCAFCAQRARYQEGEHVCQTATEALASLDSLDPEIPGLRLRLLAKALAWQSRFTIILGYPERAMEQMRKSLAILNGPELASCDARREGAFTLDQMGWTVFAHSREEARHFYEQSLALYREMNDQWWVANVLIDIAQATHDLGAFDEAKQLYQESLSIRRALGDQLGITESLAGLSLIAWVQGHLEESEKLARESLDISQETGDPFAVARGLRGVGEALIRLGQFAEGRMSMEESHATYVHLGSDYYSALTNMFLSEANAHQGRYEQARAAGEAALSFCQNANLEWDSGFALYTLGLTALGTGNFAEAQQLLEASCHAFREIDHRENLSWALALLGYVSRALGQPDQARRHLVESLRMAIKIDAFLARIYALPAIALLLADQGQRKRAIELYVLASCYGFVSNSRWFDEVAGRHIATVAETLSPEVAAAAWNRGHARDMDATIEELLAELDK